MSFFVFDILGGYRSQVDLSGGRCFDIVLSLPVNSPHLLFLFCSVIVMGLGGGG